MLFRIEIKEKHTNFCKWQWMKVKSIAMTDEKEKPKSELTFNKKQVPPESLRKIVLLTTKLSQKIKVLLASCLPMDFLPFSLFSFKNKLPTMLVIYCCITNHPNIYWLKTTMYYYLSWICKLSRLIWVVLVSGLFSQMESEFGDIWRLDCVLCLRLFIMWPTARASCPLVAELVCLFEWLYMVSPRTCLLIAERDRERRKEERRGRGRGERRGEERGGRERGKEIFLKNTRQTSRICTGRTEYIITTN